MSGEAAKDKLVTHCKRSEVPGQAGEMLSFLMPPRQLASLTSLSLLQFCHSCRSSHSQAMPALDSYLCTMRPQGVSLPPLDGILVDCIVTLSCPIGSLAVLGKERHCESNVSCLRTQHNDTDLGLNPDYFLSLIQSPVYNYFHTSLQQSLKLETELR